MTASPLLGTRPPRRAALLAGVLTALALVGRSTRLDAQSNRSAVEAFEVGSADTARLPKGKEADGIIGDFVLRNAHVEALVSGNLPQRKANMGTDWSHPTPGALYDLSVRGSDNDQLTWLAPAGTLGALSSVRVERSGPDVGVIVAERTVATGDGKGIVHRYRLGADDHCLRIVSEFRNGTQQPWKLVPAARWKEFTSKVTIGQIETGDSTNPPDEQGYAKVTLSGLDGDPVGSEVSIPPGESAVFTTLVAPGRSPAEAYGKIASLLGPTGAVSLRLRGGDAPLSRAFVTVGIDAKTRLLAYPDDEGRVELRLPPGDYVVRAAEIGRRDVREPLRVEAQGTIERSWDLGPASGIRFEVTSGAEDPRRSPCKVQFIGLGSTPTPQLGVDINAHGCRNQYHSESGHFTQQLPAGRYRVIITRGIEFDHVVRDVSVVEGEIALVQARLTRVVDTEGWVSTDFHNHSTPSGDNYCGTDDRVINLAAENIEFAPTTEHNRLYDWRPHIERLGLTEEISTVVGIELTGPNAHFNAFPLEVVPFRQDGGAPQWQHDPRLNAIVLREFQGGGADRWVQINHPSVGQFFRDRDGDGVADGGYAGLHRLIDAAETWSLEILRAEPWYLRGNARRENRTFAWLQLLNQGHRMNCVAVADAHSVVGNGVGGWRTYVRSSEDAPARIRPAEIIRNAQAGRMYVTNGPILDVRLDDGTEIGGTTVARGRVVLRVGVQCTDWIDVNRVQVLVNGRQLPSLDRTRASHPELFHAGVRRFEAEIPIDLHEDAHLIVAAVGEGLDLARGWGNTWEAEMFPCAFTNPIWVDVDGKGFRPNGDNLDHPLPTGKDPYPPPPADGDD